MARAATTADIDQINRQFAQYVANGGDQNEAPDSVMRLTPRDPHCSKAGELLDQLPPCDRAAEMMLLRALVLNGTLLDSTDLSASYFHDERHRKIFVALAKLRDNAQPSDIAHLDAQLKADGQLDEIGGRAALAEILTGESLPSSTDSYLEAVRDCHARRRVLRAATALIQDVHSDAPTAVVLRDASERLEEIAVCDLGHEAPARPQTARAMIAAHPRLHESIISGILRRQETANVIAAPKMGKSWLAYGLALSVVTGGEWLGSFPCRLGRVLLIDNELHEPTLASRLRTVADAMGMGADEYSDSLEILSLRGRLTDLHGISQQLLKVETGEYDLIILDAFYRSLPAGASENDNATIAGLYNVIDAAAKLLGCSWVNIHHSTKGSQAEKAVTDVGAGAGSQSRAADAHLILRPHEEDDAIVLEAVVRSFAPVEPLALRWSFPLWLPDGALDPTQLRGRLTKGEERQLDRDGDGRAKILDALQEGAKTVRALRGKVKGGKERTNRLLDILEDEGKVRWEEITAQGGKQRRYYLKNGEVH